MDSKKLLASAKFASNPLYKHMDISHMDSIDITSEVITDPDPVACGSGIHVTPGNIKFANVKNYAYRDVTINRYSTKKYMHFFKDSNMFGDYTFASPLKAIIISNKEKAKDYMLHYLNDWDAYNTCTVTPLYIEIAPYSNVILHEHYWKDAAAKVYRIVYVLREGASLQLCRYYKNNVKTSKHIIESRIIQHPASQLEITTTSFNAIEYLQDLYFIEAYKDTTTNIKNRYTATHTDSLHVITDINHIGPDSVSNIDVKSITDENSKFTFAGNITVTKEAENVDANLQNKNLQLSSKAIVVTEPKLDISTKEIACTHGCTVSSVDAEQMYLLNTRGFDNEKAKKLLTEAFINGN